MLESGTVTVATKREILPSNVKPLHYKLSLEPDLKAAAYNGEVSIDLQVDQDTDSISLNTLELNIQSSKLTEDQHTIESALELSHPQGEKGHVTKFSLKQPLKAGSKVTLHLTFNGILNENMVGFYRSSYKTKNGDTAYMATTQMEPTDARRAFPCFDEPALKATFTVTLIADRHLTCLSNMNVASEVDKSGKKVVTFDKTPLMSTYLLAFIVGDLTYIETTSFRVPVRVYAPPSDNIEHGRFALALAAETLKFYEEKFNSPFPLPKMDMVAIPDFTNGAMENWGLITYRTVDLMFDPAVSGASTKERVAEVVQHELAHQWFGNLVTMDFWDGLWLNEGFATWMSWYSCNIFHPEWKVWETYVNDTLQSALSLDSLRSSHPIEVPVYHPDDVNEIFDAISYSKGSCILRMISKYLGEDVFIKGIQRYLKKHAYGNTTTSDLWDALSVASGKDVGKVMDTWTKTIGYPVVTVTENSNSIHLKQNRFLQTNDVKPDEDSIYPILVSLRTKKDLELSNENSKEDVNAIMFDTREMSIKTDLDFFKLNPDQTGFYRTAYSSIRLEKLGAAAAQGLLSSEDCAGIVSDAAALAASGYSSTTGYLNFVKGLKNENSYIVWEQMLGRLADVKASFLFQSENFLDSWKRFQLDLVSAKTHQLGWDLSKDGHTLQQFKSLMFAVAGHAGDKKIIEAAFQMFQNFKTNGVAIDPNLRSAVYNIVLANNGNSEVYNFILKQYQEAPTSDQKNDALRSLGRARDLELIQRTLDLSMSNKVRPQDIYAPLLGMRTHKDGVLTLWSWTTTRYEDLAKLLSINFQMLGTVVNVCTSGFTSENDIIKVKAFFADKNTKGFERVLSQNYDKIQSRANWAKRDFESVEKWLKDNGY